MPFSTINNISTSVSNSNSTSVFFFRNACHANPGADKIVLALTQVPVKYLVYGPNQYELVNWALLK